jgi:hypothetical protein
MAWSQLIYRESVAKDLGLLRMLRAAQFDQKSYKEMIKRLREESK